MEHDIAFVNKNLQAYNEEQRRRIAIATPGNRPKVTIRIGTKPASTDTNQEQVQKPNETSAEVEDSLPDCNLASMSPDSRRRLDDMFSWNRAHQCVLLIFVSLLWNGHCFSVELFRWTVKAVWIDESYIFNRFLIIIFSIINICPFLTAPMNSHPHTYTSREREFIGTRKWSIFNFHLLPPGIVSFPKRSESLIPSKAFLHVL